MFLQFLRSYRRSIVWSICALHYLNVPTLNHTLLLLGFCWVVCLHDIPPPAFPMSTGCVSHHLVNVGILQIVETPCFSCLLFPRVWSNPFSYLHPLYKDSGVVWFNGIILKGLNCWSRSLSVGIMMVISHSWSQSAETRENDEGPFICTIFWIFHVPVPSGFNIPVGNVNNSQAPRSDDHSDFLMEHILYMAHYRSKTFLTNFNM